MSQRDYVVIPSGDLGGLLGLELADLLGLFYVVVGADSELALLAGAPREDRALGVCHDREALAESDA